jgi:hypothetical protein
MRMQTALGNSESELATLTPFQFKGNLCAHAVYQANLTGGAQKPATEHAPNLKAESRVVETNTGIHVR